MINDQSIFPKVIILLNLITFSFDYVLILEEEKIDVGHYFGVGQNSATTVSQSNDLQ